MHKLTDTKNILTPISAEHYVNVSKGYLPIKNNLSYEKYNTSLIYPNTHFTHSQPISQKQLITRLLHKFSHLSSKFIWAKYRLSPKFK